MDSGSLYLLVGNAQEAADDALVPGPGQATHNLRNAAARAQVVEATDPEIPSQWKKAIRGAVEALSKSIDASPLGFALNEVELSFGIGTDGWLGLVTGTKVEGSVTLKFAPRDAKKD